MQKASSYLYPNRIQVHTNVTSTSIQEWRIVYQRNIKIYKGLTNIIEFDVKNAEQKRIDISGYTITCVMLDIQKNEVYRGILVPSLKKGLATFTIPVDVFEDSIPQFFSYALILTDNGIDIPIYADTQFEARGRIELIDGVFPLPIKKINIVEFEHNLLDDDYSAIVSLDTLSFDSFDIEYALTGFLGNLKLSTTNDVVVTPGSVWTEIKNEEFTDIETVSILKRVQQGSPIKWLKILFTKTNAGTIDRVTITL